MPITTSQLSKMLGSVRAQAEQSLRRLNEQFKADEEYIESMFAYYQNHRVNPEPGPLLVSHTPAKAKKLKSSNAQMMVLKTSTNQVTSSTVPNDLSTEDNSSCRTLPRRGIKVECVEVPDCDNEGTPPITFIEKTFLAPAAPSKKQSPRSSLKHPKTIANPGSFPDQISKSSASKMSSASKGPSTSTAAEGLAPELHASSSSSRMGPSTRSSTRLKKCTTPSSLPTQSLLKKSLVKGSGRKGVSISAERKTLDESQKSKESIGANVTYDIVSSSKESIGINRTFVKETPSNKWIKANATHEIDSKESIGTASTSSGKESIGANSTYVIDSSNREKESVSDLESDKQATTECFLISSKANIHQTVGNASAGTTTKATNGTPFRKARNQDLLVLKAARRSLSRAKEFKIKQLKGNSSAQMVTLHAHPASGSKFHAHPASDSKFHTHPASGSKFHTHPASGSKFIKVLPTTPMKTTPLRKIPMPWKKSSVPPTDHLSKLALKALSVSKHIQGSGSKTEDKIWKKDGPRKVNGAMERNLGQTGKDTIKETKVPHSMKKHITHEEAAFKAEVTNTGLSFLSKGPTMSLQKNPFPNAVICQSSVFYKSGVIKPGTCSYDITLNPEDRSPLPSQSDENYGLDDSSDSSDDESKPKKVVPLWAQASHRVSGLLLQNNITSDQMQIFFGSVRSTPDLTKIFEKVDRRLLLRRSSAIWISPEK